MTLAEIEELRAKGWKFDFTGDRDGWMCQAVNRLAHGHGSGTTLEEAADWAMKTAGTMEDDPEVLIKTHGSALLKLAKKIFGEDVVKGIEPVESPEPSEPVRIAISVEPKVDSKTYVDQELAFIHEMMEVFPREVMQAVIMEVDWPEEQPK
jgi:hypothetical protein